MDVPKARAPVRRTGGGEGVENSAGQMRVTGGAAAQGRSCPMTEQLREGRAGEGGEAVLASGTQT